MSTLLHLFIICITVWSLERGFASGDRLVSIASGKFISNNRIISTFGYPREDEEYVFNDCDGEIKKAPGRIELVFRRSEPQKSVHCTWNIHAPANQSVYISELKVIRQTPYDDRNLVDLNDFQGSLTIEVYEGREVVGDKRLYKFLHDENLDKGLSTGQDMTIDLHYAENGVHLEHKITLSYGFIPKLQISRLPK